MKLKASDEKSQLVDQVLHFFAFEQQPSKKTVLHQLLNTHWLIFAHETLVCIHAHVCLYCVSVCLCLCLCMLVYMCKGAGKRQRLTLGTFPITPTLVFFGTRSLTDLRAPGLT